MYLGIIIEANLILSSIEGFNGKWYNTCHGLSSMDTENKARVFICYLFGPPFVQYISDKYDTIPCGPSQEYMNKITDP